MSKSQRRTTIRLSEPGDPVKLSQAIQNLERFFDIKNPIWKQPIPIWLSLALTPQVVNVKVLLSEYRRMRVELLDTRNQLKHLQRLLLQAYKDNELTNTRFTCRRHLQPIVRRMLTNF